MDTILLKKRILRTLQFFAAQHMAVTLLELHRYLVGEQGIVKEPESKDLNLSEYSNLQLTMGRLLVPLQSLVEEGVVVCKLGFYALALDEQLIQNRWRGYCFGVWREKRIRKFVRLLGYIPFVRGVALAGSQALGLEREESDIDLLVITKPSWVWFPRTLVTAYFQIFGVRRHTTYTANRFCLNHYIAGPKRMHTGRSWYTALEYAKLRPLFGLGEIYAFQKNNEDWVRTFFPNIIFGHAKPEAQKALQRVLEFVFNNFFGKSLEQIFERLQKPRIRTEEPYVIVEADELSFHPESKQDALLRAFLK